MSANKSSSNVRINYPTEPKIKYVKKAKQWVKTWFEFDRNGKAIQKQEWYDHEPQI